MQVRSSSPTYELLEKHEANSNMRPSPATTFEAIRPRDDLELHAAHHTMLLKLWVPQSAHFFVKGYLSPDIKPFLLDAGIGCWQLSQSGKSLQCFRISTLRH